METACRPSRHAPARSVVTVHGRWAPGASAAAAAEEPKSRVIAADEAYRLLTSSALLSYGPVQKMLLDACEANAKAIDAATLAREYAEIIRQALFQDAGAWSFMGANLEPDEVRSLQYITLLGWLVTIHIRRKCVGTPKDALMLVAKRATESKVGGMLPLMTIRELIKNVKTIADVRKEISELDEDDEKVNELELQVGELEERIRELQEAERQERKEREKAEKARKEKEAADAAEKAAKDAADAKAKREKDEELARELTQGLADAVARDVSGRLESLYDALDALRGDAARHTLAVRLLDETTDEQLVEQTLRNMELDGGVFVRGYLRCALKTLHRRQQRTWTGLLRVYFARGGVGDFELLAYALRLPTPSSMSAILRALWLPVVEFVHWAREPLFPGFKSWAQIEEARLTYDLSAEQWQELVNVVTDVAVIDMTKMTDVCARFERVKTARVCEALLEHYNINFKNTMHQISDLGRELKELLLELSYTLRDIDANGDDPEDLEELRVQRTDQIDGIVQWIERLAPNDFVRLHVFYDVKIDTGFREAVEDAMEDVDSLLGFMNRGDIMHELAVGNRFDYVRGRRNEFFAMREGILRYYHILLCAEYIIAKKEFRAATLFPIECYDRLLIRFGDDDKTAAAQHQVDVIHNAERKLYTIDKRVADLPDRMALLAEATAELKLLKTTYKAGYGKLHEHYLWPQVYARFMMERGLDFPRPSLKGGFDSDEPWVYEKSNADRALVLGALNLALESGDLWFY